MPNTAPLEIIAAPFDVYRAVVGTAFPLVSASPAVAWSKIGSNGSLNYDDSMGVVVEHSQDFNFFRALGDAGVRKAFRTQEELRIKLKLYDITLEPVASPRAQRSDGSLARERPLHAALKLFADKGFAKASTREIAQAAGTNIAAISYYFGDKAGLYRAAFTEPLGNPQDDVARYNQPQLSLKASLQGYFASFVEPLKQGELVQQCLRLHLREMLEPTGMWQDEIETQIKPLFAVLLKALSKHLGVAADEEQYRLAFQVMGTAVMLHVGHDVYHAICPQLIDGPEAYDRYQHRLHDYAMAMVQAEASRRVKEAQAATQSSAKSPAHPSAERPAAASPRVRRPRAG